MRGAPNSVSFVVVIVCPLDRIDLMMLMITQLRYEISTTFNLVTSRRRNDLLTMRGYRNSRLPITRKRLQWFQ
jgi:hypothetical protein